MKQFLLFIFFLILFSDFSSALTPDSLVYVYCNELDNRLPTPNWNGTTRHIERYDSLRLLQYYTNASGDYPAANFIADDSVIHIYNNLGQVINSISYNSASGSMTPICKSTYAYDSAGNRTFNQLEMWNVITAVWDSNVYTLSHYSMQGVVDSIYTRSGHNTSSQSIQMDSIAHQEVTITWILNGSNWNPVERKIMRWDSNWYYIGESSENWAGAWVDHSRHVVIRDTLERVIDEYYEIWDNTSGSWVGTDTRRVTTYDVAFQSDSVKSYWWQMGSGWYVWNLALVVRDSSNRTLSRNSLNLQDSSTTHQYYSYNAYGDYIINSYSGNGNSSYTYNEYDNLGHIIFSRSHRNSAGSAGFMNECYYYRFLSDSTVIDISDTIYSCAGAPVQPRALVVYAKEPLRYSWSPNVGLSSDTVLAPEFSVSSNRNYVLTITDSLGNIFTRNVAVIVRPLPVPSPIDTTELTGHCYPDTILITTTAQQGYTYIWYLSSGSQYMVNTDTLYFSMNGATKSFLYSMTDSFGCYAYSDTVTVSMIASPYAGIQPAVLEYCLGDTIQLYGNHFQGHYAYQWKINGIDSAGANTDNLFITQNGLYSFYLTDSLTGCDAMAAYTAQFSPQPPAVSLMASPLQILCPGDTLYLISVNTNPNWQYTWSYNSNIIPGAVSDSLAVTFPATYTLEIVDGNCPAVPGTKIISRDNFNISVTPNGSISVCDQDTLILNAGVASTYQWSTGDTTSFTMITSTGSVAVLAIDSLGCSDVSDTINISFFPPTTPPFLNYQSPILTSSYSGAQEWYLDGILIPGATGDTITPLSSGDYTVSYSDSNGCLVVSQPYTLVLVGLNNVKEDYAVRIFPNPVRDHSVIECKGNENIIGFILYDAQMRKVKEFKKEQSTITIDRDKLVSGTYFGRVELESASGISVQWIKVVFGD